jgi:flavorubredoxin
MTVTNTQSGTNVHEIADGIFRINTPVVLPGDAGGFSFNQYLIVDDEPLLFHTGLRHLFPLVREAMAHVMPVERLRHVAFSHVEADECGALNAWLAAAPQAAPLCGTVAAIVSIGDLADRPPRALPMARSCRSADIACSGSTRRTCRMPGNAASSSSRPPARCCAATCSPSRAPAAQR